MEIVQGPEYAATDAQSKTDKLTWNAPKQRVLQLTAPRLFRSVGQSGLELICEVTAEPLHLQPGQQACEPRLSSGPTHVCWLPNCWCYTLHGKKRMRRTDERKDSVGVVVKTQGTTVMQDK
ncbi:hypothetical protein JOB18_038117 [Solea senegalensis]|uniref:Uncharacterized protein n=1 Tax=Solea senegalensis TaxID=28829 RepID=A0AAV6S641_SOLSE|nr:hypothetical protein JOB18_038117 [Solea senegalensis]